MTCPMEPGLFVSAMALQVATGAVSLKPYPSTRRQPVSRSKVSFTSSGKGAPPEIQKRTVERSNFDRSGLWLIAA